MSKSPFYKTGISKSPLFDKGHGQDNESHKMQNIYASYQ